MKASKLFMFTKDDKERYKFSAKLSWLSVKNNLGFKHSINSFRSFLLKREKYRIINSISLFPVIHFYFKDFPPAKFKYFLCWEILILKSDKIYFAKFDYLSVEVTIHSVWTFASTSIVVVDNYFYNFQDSVKRLSF